MSSSAWPVPGGCGFAITGLTAGGGVAGFDVGAWLSGSGALVTSTDALGGLATTGASGAASVGAAVTEGALGVDEAAGGLPDAPWVDARRPNTTSTASATNAIAATATIDRAREPRSPLVFPHDDIVGMRSVFCDEPVFGGPIEGWCG
jgi:hypothetical protein